MMKNVKNVLAGLVCLLTLTACSGNSIEVDVEKNEEEGITAADFYEYELHEMLYWGMDYDSVYSETYGGLPIDPYIDETKSESDSKILILHWQGLPIEDSYKNAVLNDMIDLARLIKTYLVDYGYSQDVYIKVYNMNEEIVDIVSNDSEYFEVE